MVESKHEAHYIIKLTYPIYLAFNSNLIHISFETKRLAEALRYNGHNDKAVYEASFLAPNKL